MFNMNFLMYLGMSLGIFTATGILIAGVSYLIQFIQHYKRLRIFVDEVIDYTNQQDPWDVWDLFLIIRKMKGLMEDSYGVSYRRYQRELEERQSKEY